MKLTTQEIRAYPLTPKVNCCEWCMYAKWQPFKDDAFIAMETDYGCDVCKGRGTAPIPPGELGL